MLEAEIPGSLFTATSPGRVALTLKRVKPQSLYSPFVRLRIENELGTYVTYLYSDTREGVPTSST